MTAIATIRCSKCGDDKPAATFQPSQRASKKPKCSACANSRAPRGKDPHNRSRAWRGGMSFAKSEVNCEELHKRRIAEAAERAKQFTERTA